MKINRFYFEISTKPAKQTNENDEVIRNKIKIFTNKFRTIVESYFEGAQQKEEGPVIKYKKDEYEALVSRAGGFIRTQKFKAGLDKQNLLNFEPVLEPLFKEIDKEIEVYLHLYFALEGNFEKIIQKFGIDSKLKTIIKDTLDDAYTGITFRLETDGVPVNLEITKDEVECLLCFCELYKKGPVTGFQLNLNQKLDYIEKKISEANK